MYIVIKGLIFSIILFFSYIAEGSVYPDCGLKNGRIDPFSSEICPDDTILQSITTIFPEQIEKMGVANAVGYDTSLIVKSDKYNPSFATEAILARITWLFVFGVIAWWGIFNLVRTSIPLIGSAVEKGEWNKNYSKLSIPLIVLLLILFAPYGNFTFVQHLFLVFSLWGLKLATGIYAYFLADLESRSIEGITRSEIFQNAQMVETDTFEHNKSYAYQYVNSLTSAMLCKQSTNLFMNHVDATTNNYKDKLEIIDSLHIANDHRLINQNHNKETFINFTDKEVSSDLNLINGIVFGKPTSLRNTTNTFDYECGSISATLPVIKDTHLEKIAKEVKLYEFVEGIVSEIRDYSTEAIQDSIHSSAKSLKLAVAKELGLSNPDVANKQEKEILKKISLLYHQTVLAGVLVGFGVNDRGSLIKEQTTMINKSIDQAEAIATGIRELGCFDNRENVKASIRSYNFLTNGTEIKGRASTACLDVDGNGVVGVLGSESNKDIYKDSAKIGKARAKALLELELKKESFINDIYELRTAVERSYVLDIYEIDNASAYFKQLRQEGIATIATNFTTLISSFKNSNLNQSILKNTINLSSENLTGTYIVANEDANISSSYPILDKYYAQIFNGDNFKSEDIIKIDFEGYTDHYLKESTERNISGVDFKSNIISFLSSPLTQFKDVYEYENKDCVDKLICNVSSANPIQRQAEFGNTLLNVSATIIITKEILSALSSVNTERSKGTIKKNRFGKSNASQLQSLAGGFFSVINTVLAPLMPIVYLMLASGVALVLLYIALIFILKLTFLTFILNVVILFMSIPFFMLRIFRFQTNEELKKTTIEYSKLVIFVIGYLPLFMIGIFLNTILLDVVFTVISKVVFSMFASSVEDPSFYMGIISMTIVFIIMAFVNFKITMLLFRKMNDLPLDSMKKIFDSEEAEEKLARDINVIAAGSIMTAMRTTEDSRIKNIRKRIEEQEKNKNNKKEGSE